MTSKPLRILLVDDDEDDLVLVRDLLRQIGSDRYQSDWCSEYGEAIRRLTEGGFDLCIVDYRLGVKDGIELIEEARSRSIGVPLILLTGQGDRETDLAAMEAGAADFLDKSQLNADMLERALRYAVHSHRIERQRAQLLAVAEQQAAQLRYLANELTRAEQRERRRVAQTLHDHLQQLLVAAKMRMDRVGVKASAQGDEQLRVAVKQVQQLLSDSIEASRTLTVQLSPPVLHDRGLVPALEWLSRQFLKEHNLDVQVIPRDGVEINDDSVRDFLFQAVRELLFNVVKHAGTERAEVETAQTESGEFAVTVQDYGRGCDAERVIHAPRQEGFGLFHIQQRLAFLGGKFDAESQEDEGCRITLTVPLVSQEVIEEETRQASAQAQALPTIPAIPRPRPHNPDAVRVLLVDDHKILREGIAGLLLDQPTIAVVGEAADGQAAIDLVRELKPDVIVMDVSMPVLSGIEATRRIREEWPAVQVVGLSMHEKDDMAVAMREAGAFAYLPKGGPADDLVRAILLAARESAAARVP